MNSGTRCDFTVTAMVEGKRRLLTVEVKGQWHDDVMDAAHTQLSQRYASNPDAERQGIFLVLWFGPETDVAGRQNHGYVDADSLQQTVFERLPPQLKDLIDVVAIDLSKPGTSRRV